MMNNNVLDLREWDSNQTIELNKLAKQERARFLKMTSEKSKEHYHSIYWWITSFASRSNQKYVFDNICIFLYVEQYMKEHPGIKTIITDDKLLGKIIKKNLKKIKVRVISKKEKKIPRWPFFIVFWARKLKKFYVIKKIKCDRDFEKNETNILFDTYVLSNGLDANKYKDRYYSPLIPELSEKKISFSLMSLIINDCKTYKEAIEILAKGLDPYRFIIKEKYLSFIDYCQLLLYPIKCYIWAQEKFHYEQYDFSSLMKYSLLEGSVSENSMEGFIAYKFVKKLHKLKVRIEKYHMWYEGQSINNGLIYGLREFFPDCVIVGDVGLPLHENLMNFYPNELECEKGIAPDYMSFIGEKYKEDFSRLVPIQKTIMTPAYRYATIYEKEDFGEKEGILIVLSYFAKESEELLKIVFHSLEASNTKIKVKIKNHPTNSMFKLEDYNIHTKLDYQFVDTTMQIALRQCEVAIAVGTTSGTEILANGCKLMLYLPLGEVSSTCIPDSVDKNSYGIIYDEITFSKVLSQIYGMQDKEDNEFNTGDYFNKVSKETIKEYLEFDKEKSEK